MSWFKRVSPTRKAGHSVPSATRVYAVGDIHGCATELDSLADLIVQDMDGFVGTASIVLLGDLVDRGPDSARVVERVRLGVLAGVEQHVLMGNHEEAMLAVYDGSADARGWLGYGGLQTLESYGIGRAEHFERGFDLGERMRADIPSEHVEFLRSLPDHVTIGNYLFVHAGIRPGVPIERQQSADLRWIRTAFLDSDADHGVTVVHGHTISAEPEAMGNRIGIDTGCYSGGMLTALVLEGTERRFLQVPCTASAT